jgi:hypothetical protein
VHAEYPQQMEAAPIAESNAGGRLAAALGIASLALLVAATLWAHHWNPLAVAIVAGWATALIAALFTSIRALRRPAVSRRLAKLGLTLALLSVLALALAGLAYAAGFNAAGACGGG